MGRSKQKILHKVPAQQAADQGCTTSHDYIVDKKGEHVIQGFILFIVWTIQPFHYGNLTRAPRHELIGGMMLAAWVEGVLPTGR